MDQQKKQPTKKQLNFPIWYILIAAFLFMSLSSYLFNPVGGNISYSEFKSLLRDGRVESCQITSSLVKGSLRSDDLRSGERSKPLLPQELMILISLKNLKLRVFNMLETMKIHGCSSSYSHGYCL